MSDWVYLYDREVITDEVVGNAGLSIQIDHNPWCRKLGHPMCQLTASPHTGLLRSCAPEFNQFPGAPHSGLSFHSYAEGLHIPRNHCGLNNLAGYGKSV